MTFMKPISLRSEIFSLVPITFGDDENHMSEEISGSKGISDPIKI